ncbi:hypothetical protein PR048_000255 [Dryococelus australis]|uniref:DNA-directed RNA polymerase III subunit RPC3 n=1 Tax=Dryococelus australis TaxID=614101 RepID=A0ABQ9IE45_9NEOP|nr:hypothetical protein PR048_000255 [Dryococelus australis]
MRVIEVNMVRRQNERAGKMGDPQKTHHPTTSSGTILTCENPVTRIAMVVTRSLSVLVQYSLVTFREGSVPNKAEYTLIPERVLLLLRYPKLQSGKKSVNMQFLLTCTDRDHKLMAIGRVLRISHFPHSCIPVLLQTCLTSPSSALKTLLLPASQTSPQPHNAKHDFFRGFSAPAGVSLVGQERFKGFGEVSKKVSIMPNVNKPHHSTSKRRGESSPRPNNMVPAYTPTPCKHRRVRRLQKPCFLCPQHFRLCEPHRQPWYFRATLASGHSVEESWRDARVRWTHRTHSVLENPESRSAVSGKHRWRPPTFLYLAASLAFSSLSSHIDHHHQYLVVIYTWNLKYKHLACKREKSGRFLSDAVGAVVGAVVVLLTSHQVNRIQFPAGSRRFSHVGTMPGNDAGWLFFLGISSFPIFAFWRCSVLASLEPSGNVDLATIRDKFAALATKQFVMRCPSAVEEKDVPALTVKERELFLPPELNMKALSELQKGENADPGDKGIYWRVNLDRFHQDFRAFTSFTGFFQRNESLIHVLHTELEGLTTTLLRKTYKARAIERLGLDETVFMKGNLLPVKDLVVGVAVTAELMKSNVFSLNGFSCRQKGSKCKNSVLIFTGLSSFEENNPCGDLRNPTGSKVVKAVLSPSCGNACLECGFSDSVQILTSDSVSVAQKMLVSATEAKNLLEVGHAHGMFVGATVYYKEAEEEKKEVDKLQMQQELISGFSSPEGYVTRQARRPPLTHAEPTSCPDLGQGRALQTRHEAETLTTADPSFSTPTPTRAGDLPSPQPTSFTYISPDAAGLGQSFLFLLSRHPQALPSAGTSRELLSFEYAPSGYFTIDDQDDIMISSMTRRFDENVGELMRVILQQMYLRTEPWASVSNPVPFTELKDTVRKLNTHPLLLQFLEQYLKIMEEDSSCFVSKVGDSAGGQYSVNIKNAFLELTWTTVENIVLERLGSKAARIFRKNSRPKLWWKPSPALVGPERAAYRSARQIRRLECVLRGKQRFYCVCREAISPAIPHTRYPGNAGKVPQLSRSKGFALIRAKKFVEQEQIQQIAMIPAKEAKLLTYKLLEENFIQLKELRKSLEHTLLLPFTPSTQVLEGRNRGATTTRNTFLQGETASLGYITYQSTKVVGAVLAWVLRPGHGWISHPVVVLVTHTAQDL